MRRPTLVDMRPANIEAQNAKVLGLLYDYDLRSYYPMGEELRGPGTVEGCLRDLLLAVWTQGDAFDPKAPFGVEGWREELMAIVGAHYLNPGLAITQAIMSLEFPSVRADK